MCCFKSAICLPDESVKGGVKILHNQWTDSHEELVRLFKLKDTAAGKLARVEYHPDDTKDLCDLTKYKFVIDEARTPEWFDEEKQAFVTEQLRGIVERMILTGDADILTGGAFIVPKGVKVAVCQHAKILVNLGVVTVNSYGGVVTVNSYGGVVTVNSYGGVVTENSYGGVVTENSYGGVVTVNSYGGVVTENSYGKILSGTGCNVETKTP